MGKFKSIINIIMIANFIFTPSFLSGEGIEEVASPCKEAKLDAKKDVKFFPWFSLGLLSSLIPGMVALFSTEKLDPGIYGVIAGGVAGVVVSMASPTNPLPNRLMGKTPEYVEEYTRCYKKYAKIRRVGFTILGFTVSGIGCAAFVGYVILMFLSALSSPQSY